MMTIMKKVVGLVVRALLVYSIYKNVHNVPKLLLPWKWKEAYRSLRWVVGALALFMLYCIAVGPSSHPVRCFITVW